MTASLLFESMLLGFTELPWAFLPFRLGVNDCVEPGWFHLTSRRARDMRGKLRKKYVGSLETDAGGALLALVPSIPKSCDDVCFTWKITSDGKKVNLRVQVYNRPNRDFFFSYF